MNSTAQKRENYYENGKFELAANIEKYNAWLKTNFSKEVDAVIKAGTSYNGMNLDQKSDGDCI